MVSHYLGVMLFAVHFGGWDSNPTTISTLLRLDHSFLAPHPLRLRIQVESPEDTVGEMAFADHDRLSPSVRGPRTGSSGWARVARD
jgi:hypothetical protein